MMAILLLVLYLNLKRLSRYWGPNESHLFSPSSFIQIDWWGVKHFLDLNLKGVKRIFVCGKWSGPAAVWPKFRNFWRFFFFLKGEGRESFVTVRPTRSHDGCRSRMDNSDKHLFSQLNLIGFYTVIFHTGMLLALNYSNLGHTNPSCFHWSWVTFKLIS